MPDNLKFFFCTSRTLPESLIRPQIAPSKYFLTDRLCGLVVRVPGYRSEVQVPFTALPDFLRSIGFGKGFTQPREYKREAT
jgi:hypothetical protein